MISLDEVIAMAAKEEEMVETVRETSILTSSDDWYEGIRLHRHTAIVRQFGTRHAVGACGIARMVFF